MGIYVCVYIYICICIYRYTGMYGDICGSTGMRYKQGAGTKTMNGVWGPLENRGPIIRDQKSTMCMTVRAVRKREKNRKIKTEIWFLQGLIRTEDCGTPKRIVNEAYMVATSSNLGSWTQDNRSVIKHADFPSRDVLRKGPITLVKDPSRLLRVTVAHVSYCPNS